MPIDRITTDGIIGAYNPLQWVWIPDTVTQVTTNIPSGEYTLLDTLLWGDTQADVAACSTAKPQEGEEFDTTELEKYIDSLKKEAVGTKD